ncbi:MAG: Lrp/AsnC family transcriptional regulator [Alphaproteobacteria bacterium]
MPKLIGLDKYDLALLDRVQDTTRESSEELGKRVGLSATACQRRLKRLREQGYIKADVALVEPETLSRSITAVVEVTVERERPDVIDSFKKAMMDTQEVQQCYYVTGNTDFYLLVTAQDMADYEAFTRRFMQQNPDVRRFNTNVVMDTVKASTKIPVPKA